MKHILYNMYMNALTVLANVTSVDRCSNVVCIILYLFIVVVIIREFWPTVMKWPS